MNKNIFIENKVNSIKNSIGSTFELSLRTLRINDKNGLEIKCMILYLDSIIDVNILNRDIISPILSRENKIDKKNAVYDLNEKCIQVGKTEIIEDVNECVQKILKGCALILIENNNEIISCSISKIPKRSIPKAEIEKTLRGPNESFIEDINDNIALIRKVLKDKNLTIKEIKVGARSQSEVAILFIKDIADEDIVDIIQKRIESIKIDAVEDIGMIEQELEDRTFSFFAQMKVTEKPDKAVSHMLEGKVAIMMNGSPFALIAPVTLIDFLKASDDYYLRIFGGNLGIIIRCISIMLIVYLPAYYQALLQYHPDYLPTALFDPIITSRSGIPFPPFIEILFSMLIVEILREGGIRLPSPIAQTLSVVGGIIFGQAAINSKIVSSTTLLVVGISTVAGFSLQYVNANIGVRIISFVMLIFSGFFGMLGMTIFSFILISYLCSMDSFGVPYFAPFGPIIWKDFKDSVIRFPIYLMKKRSKSIPKIDYKRRD